MLKQWPKSITNKQWDQYINERNAADKKAINYFHLFSGDCQFSWVFLRHREWEILSYITLKKKIFSELLIYEALSIECCIVRVSVKSLQIIAFILESKEKLNSTCTMENQFHKSYINRAEEDCVCKTSGNVWEL